jgi:hypothetical protein
MTARTGFSPVTVVVYHGPVPADVLA